MNTTTALDRATALRAQTAAALTLAQKQKREAEVSCERLAGGLASLDILIACLQADEKETSQTTPPSGPATK